MVITNCPSAGPEQEAASLTIMAKSSLERHQNFSDVWLQRIVFSSKQANCFESSGVRNVPKSETVLWTSIGWQPIDQISTTTID